MANSNSSERNPVYVAISIAAIVILIFIIYGFDEIFLQEETLDINKNLDLSEYKNETKKYVEEYKQWTIEENFQIFDWHMRSTKIIFWVSMLVGISGIAFAFWQFVEATKGEREAAQADELELKTQLVSLAFKSRSIAALVMFMSVAYLIIYVLFVYPISSVPQSLFKPTKIPKPSIEYTKSKSEEPDSRNVDRAKDSSKQEEVQSK